MYRAVRNETTGKRVVSIELYEYKTFQQTYHQLGSVTLHARIGHGRCGNANAVLRAARGHLAASATDTICVRTLEPVTAHTVVSDVRDCRRDTARYTSAHLSSCSDHVACKFIPGRPCTSNREPLIAETETVNPASQLPCVSAESVAADWTIALAADSAPCVSRILNALMCTQHSTSTNKLHTRRRW